MPLPIGLALDEYGTITGTPTESGEFIFSVVAENRFGKDTKEFLLVVEAEKAPKILTESLPSIAEFAPFYYELDWEGDEPVQWQVSGLPEGLNFHDSQAMIYGIPREQGIFQITVALSNSVGSDSKTYNLVVSMFPAIITETLPDGETDLCYNAYIESNFPDVNWSITGNLPPGLSFENGLITGMPSQDGNYTFTVSIQNDLGNDFKTYTVKIEKNWDYITVWNGTADISWYNGGQSEYTLYTAEQLAGLAILVSDYGYSFNNVTIKLANDLYLNNPRFFDQWTWDPTVFGLNQWKPIGRNYNYWTPFQGTFDGQGYTVYGMYKSVNSDRGYNNIYDYYCGFFGYVVPGSGSTNQKNIKNLNLDYLYIYNDAQCYIGGLIGYVELGYNSGYYEIDNVHIDHCKILGPRYTGGMIGYVYNYSNYFIISKSGVKGEIYPCFETSPESGGLIAHVEASYCNRNKIEACYFEGKIEGPCNSRGAGIVGYGLCYNYSTWNNDIFTSPFKILNCRVKAEMTLPDDAGGIGGYLYGVRCSGNSFEGFVRGRQRVGGVIGQAQYCGVSRNSAKGMTDAYENLGGGLIGDAYDVILSDMFFKGICRGLQNIGGLFGQYNWSRTNPKNCYFIGEINAKSNIGLINGNSYWNYSFISFYFDNQKFNNYRNFNYYYDGNPYQTTAALKNVCTFQGYNFNKIWDINSIDNDGNPFLRPVLKEYIEIPNSSSSFDFLYEGVLSKEYYELHGPNLQRSQCYFQRFSIKVEEYGQYEFSNGNKGTYLEKDLYLSLSYRYNDANYTITENDDDRANVTINGQDYYRDSRINYWLNPGEYTLTVMYLSSEINDRNYFFRAIRF